MLLIMVVSLYTSRIVLATLGVEDYGIYNIVGGVIILFSFFNTAMSNATLRFLSFDLGMKSYERLKRTFSMSLTSYLIISLIILILAETLGLWIINSKLNIPLVRMPAANWVFQFSIFTFLVNIIRVPYNAAIIAHERMSFYAYLSVIEAILKLCIVSVLQMLGHDKLVFYSFLIFVLSIAIFWTYKIYCNRNFEDTIYIFHWDTKLFKKLISFSGWTLFGSIAVVGSKQGSNILLNLFYGVVANAAMGISNQVNSVINGFVSNFQTAFKPQIVKSFATGETEYLTKLILQTSKFSFFLMYVFALPILLNSNSFLDLWLETVPPYAVDFCRLIIVYSLLESISGPLWVTIQATGKIKKYQIIISIIILSNLWLSYLFLKLGYDPTIILWIRIVINALCLYTRILFLRKLISFPSILFFKEVILRICIVVVLTILILNYILLLFQDSNGILISTISTMVLTTIVIIFIGMTSNERNLVFSFIKKNVFQKLYS